MSSMQSEVGIFIFYENIWFIIYKSVLMIIEVLNDNLFIFY